MTVIGQFFHNIIDAEDGTGIVQVLFWRKQNECTAAQALIHECKGNVYTCVIGEATDYYGVYEIIAFDVCLFSSDDEVTYLFLEVAYSFEMMMEYAEDEMLRAVDLK